VAGVAGEGVIPGAAEDAVVVVAADELVGATAAVERHGADVRAGGLQDVVAVGGAFAGAEVAPQLGRGEHAFERDLVLPGAALALDPREPGILLRVAEG